MSPDDTDDESSGPEGEIDDIDGDEVRERLEEEADRAVEQLDEGIVDLLSWVLETETRTRIYVYLRQHPDSTSEEIANGTGLYPSTVREALAELHEEDRVTRQKRESDGAGNNPYEYAAIPPSDLVGTVVEDIQDELNTVFNLDEALGVEPGSSDGSEGSDEEPVTITVEDAETGDEEGSDETPGDETADADETETTDDEGGASD